MLQDNHPLAFQFILKIDAATCLLMGMLLMLAPGLIAGMTAISEPFLFWAGVILLPVAGFMASLSLAKHVPVWATLVVVGGNLFWAIASFLLPALGVVTPNGLGWSFLSTQAAVVAVFAWLEWASFPRTTALNQ
jgi:hypothetical protein